MLSSAEQKKEHLEILSGLLDIYHSSFYKESYNNMYLAILAVILGGQIAIVSFAGQFFGVSPLAVMDWVWICLLTMPVLLIPDICRFVKSTK